MSDNFNYNGIELVRIKKLFDDSDTRIDARNNKVMKNAIKAGIKLARWDEHDMMTSEHGAVYAMPGCGFTTQAQIDANYSSLGNRL